MTWHTNGCPMQIHCTGWLEKPPKLTPRRGTKKPKWKQVFLVARAGFEPATRGYEPHELTSFPTAQCVCFLESGQHCTFVTPAASVDHNLMKYLTKTLIFFQSAALMLHLGRDSQNLLSQIIDSKEWADSFARPAISKQTTESSYRRSSRVLLRHLAVSRIFLCQITWLSALFQRTFDTTNMIIPHIGPRSSMLR